MHYLKLFENFSKIEELVNNYNLENYTINDDGTVDINGDVDLYDNSESNIDKLVKLPFKFGKVTGNFDCENNVLITLEGCPTYVGGDFECGNNKLTSLQYCPTYVGGTIFNCSNNFISSLRGIPDINGSLFAHSNKIKSLKDIPTGCVDYFLENNPLPLLIKSNMKYINEIIHSQDEFQIWNSNGSLNKYNFKELLKEIK